MVIGITGGIGSGKSTVASLLAKRGALVIDTDAIAREVVEPPSPVLDAIVAEFGNAVRSVDGTLDRAALARVVFADPRKRAQLNRLTHPAIRDATLARIAAAPSGAVVAVVVPLLFESGFEAHCDAVIAVTADPALRARRAGARDKTTGEDIAARMSAQLPDREYERRATHVVRNDGDLAQLEAQVDRLWRSLVSGRPAAG